MRFSRNGLRAALVAGTALGAIPLAAASAQQEFPQTLYWGSGLIDIPVAWASPVTGDFALGYSGKRFRVDPIATKLNYNDRLNSQLTVSAGLFGRLEGGVAFFSSNPEYGFFVRGVLVTEDDLAARGGLLRWLPAVAVGARNLGKYSHVDRFGIGYQLLPPTPEDPDARHAPDSLHLGFDTAPTLYAVATKSMTLNQIRDSWPGVGLSLTAGVGNGLFSDDGGLGRTYASNSTGGFFYGAAVDIPVTSDFRLSFMGENNAWDFNVGASATYRGLRAGVYVTELGAGSASSIVDPLVSSGFYNYRKVAFTFGWQSNILALLQGDFLQKRADRLAREREQLLADITARQQRVATLQGELSRIEAQNLLELEQRRAAAEVQLRQERDALRRLEDRLKRVEQQRGITPPTKP
ncbi:MAG TPA: hypothetical protein VM076_14560 [Gemmatimonadaceae bacterium]|nr:hypothetical protein [Gemmatimonadaceae bacterium]